MSLLVSQVIGDAADDVADPGMTSVLPSQWLTFYNAAIREVCERWSVLKAQDCFDLSTELRYAYPPLMVRMTELLVTATPDDMGSYTTLNELFEDEYRSRVQGAFPAATLPESYFPDRSWFTLFPSAAAAIINGGMIRYFTLPERVLDIETGNYELPEWTQDQVRERMVIEALKSLDQYNEAAARYGKWLAEGDRLEDRLEDVSEDRRTAIRPKGSRYPYRGMR